MSLLTAKDLERSTLPVISVAGLFSPDPHARVAVAREIRAACVDNGFFYICDHGVSEALTARVLQEARRFFALPLERKRRIEISASSAFLGYEPLRAQTLEAGTPADLKESFSFDTEPNQWPDDLPGWRETLEAYRETMKALAVVMTRAMALSLDLPEDALDGFCADPSAIVRLVHYPPQPADSVPGEKGCGAHTDWGAFTFLLQDDAGGLQVWDQSEGWVHAAPLPGTFVVNVGDLMARWTNDRYHSTLHRVVNVSGRDRISVPFFYSGRLDYDVACFPSCLAPGESPKYPRTTPADHLHEMARRTFAG